MKTNTKRFISAIFGLLLVIGLLGAVKAAQIGAMINAGKSFVPPPETVTETKVEKTEWIPRTSAVGSLVAVHAVTLGAELPGTIRQITFDSGSPVKEGQVLVKLDTSTEEAQVASAAADLKLARVNLERTRGLRNDNAVAAAELDTAEAREAQARAMLANLQATLAKKTIRAPFDGRIAIRQVELGQVVSPGTPIASLQSIDPIYAEFWLPQHALADLKIGQSVEAKTDTFPEHNWEGKLTAINPEVDTATRNVKIRATLPNADGRLRPGMFVNVNVLSEHSSELLIIPATAILYAPYGDSVFAIEDAKDDTGNPRLTVRQTFVRLGERRGDMVAVISGLVAGERIVSNGAFKLRNGQAVAINNALAPPAELAPKPSDQ